MSDTEDNKPGGDYEVGYGRPPKSGQFKKGDNPNPNGRPKHSYKPNRYLLKELRQRVTVPGKNGRECTMPLEQLIDRQLARKAAGGDIKAMKEIRARLTEEAMPDQMAAKNRHLMEKIKQLQDELEKVKEEKKGGILGLPRPPVNSLERKMLWAEDVNELMEYIEQHPDELVDMIKRLSYRLRTSMPPNEFTDRRFLPSEPPLD